MIPTETNIFLLAEYQSDNDDAQQQQALLAISNDGRHETEPCKPLTPANSSPEPREHLAKLQLASLRLGNPFGGLTCEAGTADQSNVLEFFSYAKLAGNGWVYFVKSTCCTLGCQQEVEGLMVPSVNHIGLPCADGLATMHAQFFFNSQRCIWEFELLERDDAYVDGYLCKPFQPVPLHSGSLVVLGANSFFFLLPSYGCLVQLPLPSPSSNSLQQPCPSISGPAASQKPLEANTFSITESAVGDTQPDVSPNLSVQRLNPEFERPGKSYFTLITEAIMSTPEKKITLNGIYEYLMNSYPYFTLNSGAWQNSVRHNLSLNKAFVRIPRKENDPGKGMYWTLVEPVVEAKRHKKQKKCKPAQTPKPSVVNNQQDYEQYFPSGSFYSLAYQHLFASCPELNTSAFNSRHVSH